MYLNCGLWCFLMPLTPKKFGLEWDLNPGLSNACAVLHQLSYQANWELVILWIGYKLVDDGYRSTCKYMILVHESLVFEL